MEDARRGVTLDASQAAITLGWISAVAKDRSRSFRDGELRSSPGYVTPANQRIGSKHRPSLVAMGISRQESFWSRLAVGGHNVSPIWTSGGPSRRFGLRTALQGRDSPVEGIRRARARGTGFWRVIVANAFLRRDPAGSHFYA